MNDNLPINDNRDHIQNGGAVALPAIVILFWLLVGVIWFLISGCAFGHVGEDSAWMIGSGKFVTADKSTENFNFEYND